MSERPNEPDARQQRLDALRSLAHDEPAAPTTTETPPAPTPAPPTLSQLAGFAAPRRPASWLSRWRRWRAPALVIVAAVVIFGVVIGAILRQSGFGAPFAAHGGQPAAPLTPKVYNIGLSLYCPSTPAWSPNGKQLALVAQTQVAPGGCPRYDGVTAVAQDSADIPGGSATGATAIGHAVIAIFDASSGRPIRSFTIPALPTVATPLQCPTGKGCGIANVTLESLSWSPDGRTVGAFYSYSFGDSAHWSYRGALVLADVSDASAPRLLTASGRQQIVTPDQSVATTFSPPRFIWNLATGQATATDIPASAMLNLTTAFAQGYRLGDDGALTLDQRAQAGDVSPWRSGSLQITNPRLSIPPTPPLYSYQLSQWLWSPNGRYALPNLDAGAYLRIAGLTGAPQTFPAPWVNEASVSAPDAATTQLISALAPTHSPATLAWNPARPLLASYDCVTAAGQRADLTIRAARDGKKVAQAQYPFPLTTTSLGCIGNIGPIAWSPDGTRLAVSDEQDAQFIVWQVNVRG